MAATKPAEGTARVQGELWGARARDWAVQEEQHRALYQAGIRLTGITQDTTVLDVGCGSGLFCRLAADAGATVSGIDASPAMVEIASTRVPEGEFLVGELQFLPHADNRFDVVTGFNAFQYAADPVAALAEAGRVAKPMAPVFALVWGRQEHTELVAVLRALRPLLPPAPPNAPGPFALSYEGALESLFERAGLGIKEAGYLEATFDFPDEETLVRATLAAGPAALAIRTSGEEPVRDAIRAAVATFRTAAGGFQIETEWRYVTGTA